MLPVQQIVYLRFDQCEVRLPLAHARFRSVDRLEVGIEQVPLTLAVGDAVVHSAEVEPHAVVELDALGRGVRLEFAHAVARMVLFVFFADLLDRVCNEVCRTVINPTRGLPSSSSTVDLFATITLRILSLRDLIYFNEQNERGWQGEDQTHARAYVPPKMHLSHCSTWVSSGRLTTRRWSTGVGAASAAAARSTQR